MVNLKYAVVERERRWLLKAMPDRRTKQSRAEARPQGPARRGSAGGGVHVALPRRDGVGTSCRVAPKALEKQRVRVSLDGVVVAVDEFRGELSGLVLAEIDGGGTVVPPANWPVRSEVTGDERYTGVALALAARIPVLEVLPQSTMIS